ncbi:hypothetical protein [Xanthomonas campestris]|uniref:hypothetical protein n=1 Tax=Xanthomonas campestris TaxID=339 RepID=UPI001CBA7952|nr:hypothetical protein [Xanthomonas campestris]MEA9731836.1 hypothetical protein [Xanthomonas campestris]UAU34906.1 hypothetical protein JH290_01465 [Xanthomonas campestris pv. incanae]WDJ84884.1 hypothetical protein JH279_20290 [Xanthomonas campestris pv. incanae]WDJ94120.1 hypothetical protein JH260_00975 [Xanthomonas campestris pv. incanae]WDK26027.1 hypothetical protein JH274_01250 [Xanthomonas campestris pv. incanae]
MQHRHRVRWGAPLLVLTLLSACRLPLPGESDQTVVPMDADRVLIGRVQGAGASSPLLGQEVRIEGIVTRSLAGDEDDLAQEVIETVGEATRSRPIGWFVQDEGDGVDATSDALFVLDQGYDTGIGMPGEGEFTLRLGTRVRSGDRVQVWGVVAEVAQAIAADQPRSSGHPVSRGDAAGSITTLKAGSITLLSPRERRPPIVPRQTPVQRGGDESSEGMRLLIPAKATAATTRP